MKFAVMSQQYLRQVRLDPQKAKAPTNKLGQSLRDQKFQHYVQTRLMCETCDMSCSSPMLGSAFTKW